MKIKSLHSRNISTYYRDFGNHSDEKFIYNFPFIMPYFGHIVEQPIETFYCGLLISSKVRICMIYVIDFFV